MLRLLLNIRFWVTLAALSLAFQLVFPPARCKDLLKKYLPISQEQTLPVTTDGTLSIVTTASELCLTD